MTIHTVIRVRKSRGKIQSRMSLKLVAALLRVPIFITQEGGGEDRFLLFTERRGGAHGSTVRKFNWYKGIRSVKIFA